MRGSALMRDKLNRGDYIARTINAALASGGPTYSGGWSMGNPNNGATNGPTNGTAPAVENREVWPDPVESAAVHGPAGDFARAAEPYYEGESVALLIQFLLVFGNLVGRNLVFMHLNTAHYINLFPVIVGSTAAAAKGTGWNLVRSFFEYIDALLNERIHGGLSSGEGLIHCVRDRKSEEQTRGRGKNRHTEVVVVDPGVTDKRVVIFETEFSSTLRVIARPENIVSEIIRGAFDGQHILQTLVKNNPERATDAHISVVGHITPRELRELLTETSMANGFGNRFPLFLVRGTKRIPIPDTTDLDKQMADIVGKVKEAHAWAQQPCNMYIDVDAVELWNEVYPELYEPGPDDLLGEMLARARAHTARFAMAYAALDKSPSIGREHLEAALALWRYASRSATYLFGKVLGNPDAETILAALHVALNGLNRTEISKVFNHNLSKKRIDNALLALKKDGKAYCNTVPTSGRPAELWFEKN